MMKNFKRAGACWMITPILLMGFTSVAGNAGLPGSLSEECKADWGNSIISSNRKVVAENPGKKFPTKQIVRSSIDNTTCLSRDQKTVLLLRLEELSRPLSAAAAQCDFFKTSNMEPTHLTVTYLIHTLKSLKNPPTRGDDKTQTAIWMANRWLLALLAGDKALLDFHPKAPINGCDQLMQITRDISRAMRNYIRRRSSTPTTGGEDAPQQQSISL